MESKWELDIKFIDQGDIYFFYKPKKTVENVKGIGDIARFYFVLAPADNGLPSYIVMGNKGMPKVVDSEQGKWGFVQIVGGRGFKTYTNPTTKRLKTASRPVGEGIYSIISHRNHTHLLYVLELPEKLGPVQKAFNIQKEANYIFLARTTDVTPKSPEEPFSNFLPATVENIKKRGTEILLIGIGPDIGRLGIKANYSRESEETADIFSKLSVNKLRHPTGPLISGQWE